MHWRREAGRIGPSATRPAAARVHRSRTKRAHREDDQVALPGRALVERGLAVVAEGGVRRRDGDELGRRVLDRRLLELQVRVERVLAVEGGRHGASGGLGKRRVWVTRGGRLAAERRAGRAGRTCGSSVEEEEEGKHVGGGRLDPAPLLKGRDRPGALGFKPRCQCWSRLDAGPCPPSRRQGGTSCGSRRTRSDAQRDQLGSAWDGAQARARIAWMSGHRDGATGGAPGRQMWSSRSRVRSELEGGGEVEGRSSRGGRGQLRAVSQVGGVRAGGRTGGRGDGQAANDRGRGGGGGRGQNIRRKNKKRRGRGGKAAEQQAETNDDLLEGTGRGDG